MPFWKAKADPTFTIDLIEDTDIALFHWKGPITLEDRRKNTQKVVDFCRSKSVSKVIVDGRDQESATNTFESFNFGAGVPSAMRGLSIAVVHRPDDDSLKFIETVASNRGSSSKSFEDIEEARRWLEEQNPATDNSDS